jgi:hypothetical protein
VYKITYFICIVCMLKGKIKSFSTKNILKRKEKCFSYLKPTAQVRIPLEIKGRKDLQCVSLQIPFAFANRVARFFYAQHTKMGKNIPDYHKIYHTTTQYSNWP